MRLLQPAAGRPQRRAAAQGASSPAPVGGWNARDALDGMAKEDAIILDNWFPETNRVRLRRGHSSHATGIGSGQVETLMPYASGTTTKLLAAGNDAIYDVSSSGAVGAALASGLTSNRWQFDNFKGSLIMVNGSDAPKTYNGSTVSNASITGSGLTPADLIQVNVFKQRLFFVEKSSLSFWYLAVDSISGVASEFPLDAYCKHGGELMAMASWTRDGGDGVDDLAVFITSKGEVLIFSGTDPGDASNWSLIGVFRVGEPLGRRCFMKMGSDLVAMLEDGFFPLSRVLVAGASRPDFAISDKIGSAVSEATRLYSANFGWQPVLYPRGNYALFNVPKVTNSEAQQYVMNTITGAWCRFTGQNANCWAVYNQELYFGGTDGTVYKADSGASDNGANITGDAKTSFQHYGGRGMLKRFTMVRPLIATDGNLPVAIDLNVDFEDTQPVAVPSAATTSSGSAWDEELWDEAEWGSDANIRTAWISVNRLGYSAAIRMKVATKALTADWYSTDWLFEKGGFL